MGICYSCSLLFFLFVQTLGKASAIRLTAKSESNNFLRGATHLLVDKLLSKGRIPASL